MVKLASLERSASIIWARGFKSHLFRHFVLAVLVFLSGTVNACVGAIIGASNEKGDPPAMQLGEALEFAAPQCKWENYAIPGAYSDVFYAQSIQANDINPDVVVVGLTIELFRARAIDLLPNMHRIAALHKDALVVFLVYPESLLEDLDPANFIRAKEYDLANLKDFNEHMGYLRDDRDNVILIEYPQYVPYDGLHADAASQMAVAQRIALNIK